MTPSPDRQPNYHFLLIAPNLGAEWFFDAARQYWERYRPVVVSDLELARLLPFNFDIIITLISRKDSAPQWGVLAASYAYFDPVVQDQFDTLKLTLQNRVALNQPFGVPLAPIPTAPPAINATPGAVVPLPTTAPVTPTRAPAFVTEAPPSNPIPDHARRDPWGRLMRLDEYQWSRNPRGLHVRQVLVTPLDFGHWTYPQMGWTEAGRGGL